MRFAILVLLATCIATAQPAVPKSPFDAQEQSSVALLFQSSRPEDLAWGAYLAANYQQPKFVPQIIELLKVNDHKVQLVAFDALIRLKADVPESALTPLIDTYFVPTVLLLARNVKTHAALLMSLLDRPLSDENWVVVNSVLAEARAPGYAARLLRDWTLPLGIGVLTSGGMGTSHGDRGPGMSLCGDLLGTIPSGFPPITYYHLEERPRPDAAGPPADGSLTPNLLAGGVHPVIFYASSSASQCSPSVPRDDYRFDYLRALQGLSPMRRPEDEPPYFVSLLWTDEKAYRSDVEAFLAKVRSFVKGTRNRLIRQKVLDADDPAQPMLQVEVIDERTDKSTPLPVIDWHL